MPNLAAAIACLFLMGGTAELEPGAPPTTAPTAVHSTPESWPRLQPDGSKYEVAFPGRPERYRCTEDGATCDCVSWRYFDMRQSYLVTVLAVKDKSPDNVAEMERMLRCSDGRADILEMLEELAVSVLGDDVEPTKVRQFEVDGWPAVEVEATIENLPIRVRTIGTPESAYLLSVAHHGDARTLDEDADRFLNSFAKRKDR